MKTLMKCAVIYLFSTYFSFAQTNWYVDGIIGLDGYNGLSPLVTGVVAEGPFRTITQALNACSDGDIINIAAFTYSGPFIVTKTVTLNGYIRASSGYVDVTIDLSSTDMTFAASGTVIFTTTIPPYSGLSAANRFYCVGSATTGFVFTSGNVLYLAVMYFQTPFFNQSVAPSASENIIPFPDEYYLGQNYPNPFNPNTKISFYLPEESDVLLIIYDTLGREVEMIINETLSAGNHSVDFNGKNLASGVYYYKLETKSISEVKKMILLR